MGSVFRDADDRPSDAAVRDMLGSRAGLWEESIALLADVGAPVTWRFYRDGGWLAKAVAGRRTIAWLAVEKGLFRVTFYFAERHRTPLRNAHGLTREVRERLEVTPLIGRLLPVTLEVRSSADVDLVRAVLTTKLTVK